MQVIIILTRNFIIIVWLKPETQGQRRISGMDLNQIILQSIFLFSCECCKISKLQTMSLIWYLMKICTLHSEFVKKRHARKMHCSVWMIELNVCWVSHHLLSRSFNYAKCQNLAYFDLRMPMHYIHFLSQKRDNSIIHVHMQD